MYSHLLEAEDGDDGAGDHDGDGRHEDGVQHLVLAGAGGQQPVADLQGKIRDIVQDLQGGITMRNRLFADSFLNWLTVFSIADTFILLPILPTSTVVCSYGQFLTVFEVG